jgi:predicted DCC family thiol-disulfide oxidoreductase YuxK
MMQPTFLLALLSWYLSNANGFAFHPALTASRLRILVGNYATILDVDGVNDNSVLNESKTKNIINGVDVEDVDWDWEKLAKDVFSQGDERPIILFDGICNLCNGGVNFALDQDESGKLRFCSLQSKVGQSLLLRMGKSPHDMTSIIMTTKDQAYFSSEAVARICSQLDDLSLQVFGKLGQITPEFIRESIYQFISKHRYQLGGGEYDQCRMDYDGTYVSRFVQDPEEL